jgi:hypothetical protein
MKLNYRENLNSGQYTDRNDFTQKLFLLRLTPNIPKPFLCRICNSFMDNNIKPQEVFWILADGSWFGKSATYSVFLPAFWAAWFNSATAASTFLTNVFSFSAVAIISFFY